MSRPYPRYYDLDGRPVKVAAPGSVPQAMRPDGTWAPYIDPKRMAEAAAPVDEGQFALLRARYARAPIGELPLAKSDRRVGGDHPPGGALGEGTSPMGPAVAGAIEKALAASPDPDYWLALFAAALDEGAAPEEAVRLASEAAREGA